MVTVIGVLLIIMGIFLVISVLMQSSKNHRVSGSIAGGAETFFGKQKGKTLDAVFNKLTTVVTIVFVILVLALCFILPTAEEAVIEQTVDSYIAQGMDVTAADFVINEDGTIGFADPEAFMAKYGTPVEEEVVEGDVVETETEDVPADEEAPVVEEEAPVVEETPAEEVAEQEVVEG